MKKNIFTTLANFADIRKKNGLYIDKTKHIYECIKNDKYFFLARPRRFGKSLLCSTLRELFSGNRSLFSNLWIDQSDWIWDHYPVIHLDMSIAAGVGNTVIGMKQKLFARLIHIAKNYDVDEPNQHAPIELALELLVINLYKKLDR